MNFPKLKNPRLCQTVMWLTIIGVPVAAASVICGIVILWQPDAFRAMFEYYKSHLGIFAILIISIIFSLFFIFHGKTRQSNEKKAESDNK